MNANTQRALFSTLFVVAVLVMLMVYLSVPERAPNYIRVLEWFAGWRP